MAGYENPFTTRIAALDVMRRIKGDTTQARCVTNYLRRRLLNGAVTLTWNPTTKVFTPDEPRVESAIHTFNRHYEFAALPGPRTLVGRFLGDLKAYYGLGGTIDDATRARLEETRKLLYDAYGLALCADPATLPAHQGEPNHPPIVKPLFKYVVKPGEAVSKTVIAIDPDNDPLTITVTGLPAGAAFDAQARVISWTPGGADAGVHLLTVTANDGAAATSRPFALIVKANAGQGPIPAAPPTVTAALTPDDAGVVLTWTRPAGVTVAAYVIYRDGIMWAAVPGDVLTMTDTELIVPSSKTRYNVSLYAATGAESGATDAQPAIVQMPPQGDEIRDWAVAATHGGAGEVGCPAPEGYIESRAAGIAKVQITFGAALDPATIDNASVTIVGQRTGDQSGRISGVSLQSGGTVLVVQLSSALPDVDKYTFTVSNSVKFADGGSINNSRARCLCALAGDVDASGVVAAGDVLAVRSRAGQALSAANARYDVNCSGAISGDDILTLRNNLGHALP